MKRQKRTLVVLAVLVVACLGGYLALRAWNQDQEEASHTYVAQLAQVEHLSFDPEGQTLPSFQEEDVEQVKLSQGEQAITLTTTAQTQTQETDEVDEEGAAVTQEVTVYTWYRDGQELPQDSQAVDTLLSADWTAVAAEETASQS